MNKTHRIKVLGLLGLPLLALALAVMVFTWGSSTDTTEAAVSGAAMSMAVTSGTTTCPATKTGGETCVGFDTKFTITVSADEIPLPAGYIGAQAWIQFGATGLVCKSISMDWPDGVVDALVGGPSAEACNAGSATGPLANPVPSTYKGPIFSFSLNCTSTETQHTITLEQFGGANAGNGGSGYSDGTVISPVPESSIDLNCVPPPTETPTSTPPPIPKMSKSPALQNVFLTKQQTSKIPPTDCLAGANIGGLSEALNQEIVSPNPKNITEFQQLSAFEFEVHYDNKKVCVDITAGDEFANSICIVEDDEPDSKPQLEGVARIGCATVGKSDVPETDPNFHVAIDELIPLAQVDVYPQPEIYSQAKPNQDNGVVVQVNNVNCDLGDEQGHAIPIFSCDDADITFRYLEGDVVPDCVIDAVDAQSIAFRWGVEKGSLIYRDFMNLEPSSQQQDNDIDINDLQFVYGRFGSSCELPHPPQPPVNPKA